MQDANIIEYDATHYTILAEPVSDWLEYEAKYVVIAREKDTGAVCVYIVLARSLDRVIEIVEDCGCEITSVQDIYNTDEDDAIIFEDIDYFYYNCWQWDEDEEEDEEWEEDDWDEEDE